MLSLGGRITMIDTVLSVMPTYFLSFSAILRWTKREIDALRRKFLWGRAQKDGKAFCLVNWKWVCKHKKFGGLGIINLWDFYIAVLLKWWWKLFDDPTRKWVTIVSNIYQTKYGWWSDQCINEVSSSPLWKSMAAMNDTFFIGIAKEVKDGRGTRFWNDKWCSRVFLGALFPRCSLFPKTLLG